MKRIGQILFLLCLLAGGMAGCMPPAGPGLPAPSAAAPATLRPQTPAPAWPGDAWPIASPQAVGLDPAQVQALVKAARRQAPNLSSLMVVRRGQAVVDEYFGSRGPNDRLEVYSVTKSFIATLVGIAIDQGFIAGLDEKALTFFPDQTFANPSPEKDALRLEDILTMSSGLKWSEDDINRLYPSPDWASFMLDLPSVEPPGKRFNYCTGCSHLLSVILQKATGMDALSFARQFLFDPIGIRDAEWLEDSQGQPIGGWGLQLTPHDLARLGQLYLHAGNWDGRPVISSAWVKTAVAEHVAVTDNPRLSYGYHWWLRPSMHGYAALGRNGQMIAVIPDQDLVVVFTANGVDHEVEFQLIENYLLPAIQP